MSVFGSRSSSIDSLNNSNRNSDDSLPILDNSNNKVLSLHNPIAPKRRRELSFLKQCHHHLHLKVFYVKWTNNMVNMLSL